MPLILFDNFLTFLVDKGNPRNGFLNLVVQLLRFGFAIGLWHSDPV